MGVAPKVTPEAVRKALRHGGEIALIDVRPEGIFAKSHPLLASCLRLGHIELRAFDLLPNHAAPIVVYDDGEGYAPSAAQRLSSLGYLDISILDGGLRAWRDTGGELFRGVNVVGKSFAELLVHKRGTPQISSSDLSDLLGRHSDVLVLDARPLGEYQTMNIPTAINVPGGQLATHIGALVERPQTLVVINCAGRTRSLMGAESLRRIGVGNHVVALENGTMGWQLAGLELQHGANRTASVRPTAQYREGAIRFARQAGVQEITFARLEWLLGQNHTTYRFDIRLPEEYRCGHLPGFRSIPGGQLLQEVDSCVAVRGATIVLSDDDGIRANVTGAWLAQMGWSVCTIDQRTTSHLVEGPWLPTVVPVDRPKEISVADAEVCLRSGNAHLLDVGTSREYEAGHIPGAFYVWREHIREGLDTLPARDTIIITSSDGTLAAFAANDLAGSPNESVYSLAGGTQAWELAGLGLEHGLTGCLSSIEDEYRRPYEGAETERSVMEDYLQWEVELVEQLDRDGTHNFSVV